MYGHPCGEFLCGYWGLKGYVVVVVLPDNDNY